MKKTYNLFRMNFRQRHLGLKLEPITFVFADEAGIMNISEANEYFLSFEIHGT